jgi:hypothetical protein
MIAGLPECGRPARTHESQRVMSCPAARGGDIRMTRRALAILEEPHDLVAEEVRSRLGAKPGPAAPSVC